MNLNKDKEDLILENALSKSREMADNILDDFLKKKSMNTLENDISIHTIK